MPLTITLQSTAPDRAEAHIDGQLLASFEPQALLGQQPLHPTKERRTDPVAYGRQLLAALGGDGLLAHIQQLPRAPSPASQIAIRTAEPQLAGIPWEYLHTGQAFVAQEHLFVREVPVAPGTLPESPDPRLP